MEGRGNSGHPHCSDPSPSGKGESIEGGGNAPSPGWEKVVKLRDFLFTDRPLRICTTPGSYSLPRSSPGAACTDFIASTPKALTLPEA